MKKSLSKEIMKEHGLGIISWEIDILEKNKTILILKNGINSKITLIGNGDVVQTEEDTAHVLSTFFFNIVTNLKFLNTLALTLL